MINLIRVICGYASILFIMLTYWLVVVYGFPFSEHGIFTQIIVFSIFSAPFSLIAAIILSFRNTKFLYLPLIHIVIFIIGYLGVEIIQHGRLAP